MLLFICACIVIATLVIMHLIGITNRGYIEDPAKRNKKFSKNTYYVIIGSYSVVFVIAVFLAYYAMLVFSRRYL